MVSLHYADDKNAILSLNDNETNTLNLQTKYTWTMTVQLCPLQFGFCLSVVAEIYRHYVFLLKIAYNCAIVLLLGKEYSP